MAALERSVAIYRAGREGLKKIPLLSTNFTLDSDVTEVENQDRFLPDEGVVSCSVLTLLFSYVMVFGWPHRGLNSDFL